MAMLKPMSEEERELFCLFKSAIEAERGAQSTYMRAVELCTDPILRSILQGFHEDEVRHEQVLRQRYEHYRNGAQEPLNAEAHG